jgi:uncharacterized protein YrzB (UPF0473 family)
VTLTVTDANGNVSTCDAQVTIEDNVAPTAICQDITVQLDANGEVTITAADIDNGAIDNCGTVTLTIDGGASDQTFDCTSVGVQTVTLTVTDANGNVSTCDAQVTIEDNVAPTAICQDITVQLDANGEVVITAADIDNGSNRQLRSGDAHHQRRRERPDVRLHLCWNPDRDTHRDRCQRQHVHL